MAVRNGIYKVDNGNGTFDEINLKSNAGQIFLKDGRNIQDIFDKSNKLWEGAAYMVGSSVAAPTKPLDQCLNGWILVWSDYDPGDGPKNWNWAYSYVSKKAVVYNDNNYFAVPSYTTGVFAKSLFLTKTAIKGDDENVKNGLDDICLRYIYEW